MTKTYSDKNILITGANGFSGTWLSAYLSQLGARIYGCGEKQCHTSSFYDAKTTDVFHQFDYLDITSNGIFEKTYLGIKFDYIFHLAAQPLVINAYRDPSTTFQTNVVGTINLINYIVAKQSSSKNLFVTTDKVYLNNNSGSKFNEDDILWGNEPYASSKVAMEAVIHGYFQALPELKRNSVIARAGNIFGGGDFSENRLIVDYFAAKSSGRPISVREPEAVRPWQHVSEVITAYCSLLSQENLDGEAYNISPEAHDCISVRELLTRFNDYNDKKVNITYDKAPKNYESKFLLLDNKKIKAADIWQPRITLDDGIDLTCFWYSNYRNRGGLQLIKQQLVNYFHA